MFVACISNSRRKRLRNPRVQAMKKKENAGNFIRTERMTGKVLCQEERFYLKGNVQSSPLMKRKDQKRDVRDTTAFEKESICSNSSRFNSSTQFTELKTL